jgi:carotenoid cleavage dioxygenase-like enzyme
MLSLSPRPISHAVPFLSSPHVLFNRYSYGFTGFLSAGYSEWGLVKLDHHIADENNNRPDKEISSVVWSSPNCFPSEAVFVPNPLDPSQEEDNGVLLSQVYDGDRKETFLLVLDASDLSELARYYTGIRCPVSFHGQFTKL